MGKLPMDIELLPAYEDYIFKTIMTHPDARPALIDLVSAVIGREVVDITVINNELPLTDTEEKKERLDLNCVIDDGSQVNVEMQGSRMAEHEGSHLNFINKSVYYLADLHSSQKASGLAYSKLVRTYQITFVNYTVFASQKDYLTQGCIRTQSGRLISDQLNISIIELSKLKSVFEKPIEQMTSLDMWSIFLGHANDPDKREQINKMIEKKGELAMATSILTSISKDDRERAKFLSRRKYETDRLSNLATAESIGEARGMEMGISQVARNMKHEGIPFENIAKFTNLSIDEIQKL